MDALKQVDDVAIWLAAVVGGLVALGWLWRKARRAWKSFKRARAWAQSLGELVEYELAHNGGGSIKDRVALIPTLEENQQTILRRFEEHLTQAAARDARDDAMERRLMEHAEVLARLTPEQARQRDEEH